MSESPPPDTWRALLRAHAAALRRIEADLAAAGEIPLRWYDVLLELDRSPAGRFHMQELAERVVLSRSRVSRVVDELERAGYVERAQCPSDRRSYHAQITPEGRRALRDAAPVYGAAIDAHFTRHLTTDERSTLDSALSKVAVARPN